MIVIAMLELIFSGKSILGYSSSGHAWISNMGGYGGSHVILSFHKVERFALHDKSSQTSRLPLQFGA